MVKKSLNALPPAAAIPPAQEREEAEALAALLPVSAQIEHFLKGRTDGRALLEALYDPVLDEEVPARLKDLLPK